MKKPVVATLSILFFSACVSRPRIGASENYSKQAKAAYDKGRYDRAIELYSRAVEENPKNAEAYVGRGNCFLKRSDPASNPAQDSVQAIDDYTRAIEIFPMYESAFFNRAMANCTLARYREAVADLRQLAEWGEQSIRMAAHLKLGQILYEKYEGREKEALASLEAYLSLGGQDPGVRQLVEELRREASGGGEATSEEIEKKAAALVEDAKVLYASGRKDKALKTLIEVLRQYPGSKAAKETAPRLIMGWSEARDH